MFNSANILERLRNGETPEDIANEMTNALNKAQDELKAEKAKAAQEQEKEEKGLSFPGLEYLIRE